MILKVELKQHRDQDCIFIFFDKDNALLMTGIRRLNGRKYSETHKAWYLKDTKENRAIMKEFYQKHHSADALPIKEDVKLKIQNPIIPLVYPIPKKFPTTNLSILLPFTKTKKDSQKILLQLPPLDEKFTSKIEKFILWLKSRRYSENTIRSYIDCLSIFLRFNSDKSLIEINNQDLIQFNNEYILAREYSASFQNQIVNAIKLFFKIIEETKIDVDLIHRPKRSKLLPNVLSKEEVKLILNAHYNLKHKTMLSLIYSCGLRCGELLTLKPEHVDSYRNVLIIKQAKGRRDRISPLSTKIIKMLREYFEVYKPKVYLFEGRVKGETYDMRSLQLVLKQALQKVSIMKPVSLHWLRHSYATHLLENGTDLRYIQEILGHKSSRTTEIYTHVSTKNIQNIKSPFDSL